MGDDLVGEEDQVQRQPQLSTGPGGPLTGEANGQATAVRVGIAEEISGRVDGECTFRISWVPGHG